MWLLCLVERVNWRKKVEEKICCNLFEIMNKKWRDEEKWKGQEAVC